jgi:hypothetical protein
MAGRLAAEVAFTDREGSHWIRRATGRLEELPQEPLEYFQQWDLYGTPRSANPGADVIVNPPVLVEAPSVG